MKISEAIEKLTVKRDDALHFQKLYRAGDVGWSANESKAIAFNIAINTLQQIDEPQDEKVEVPDYVAEWLENHPDAKELSSKFNWWNLSAVCGGYISDPEYIFASWFNDKANSYGNRRTLLKAILNGYTVKPKRWVVKYIPPFVDEFKYYSVDDEIFDITESSWTSDKEDAYPFTEKEKAEAVATLVEGSVEEV